MDRSQNDQIKKHHEHTHLAGEYKYGDSGQIILLILFVIGVLLDTIFFHTGAEYRQAVSLFIRIPLSVICLCFSLLLIQSSHKTIFDSSQNGSTVVDRGAYGVVRHPMYLGMILFYLTVTVLFLSVIAMIILLIIIIFYYFIARYEERILLDKFGQVYERYMNRVPMLIPCRWRASSGKRE